MGKTNNIPERDTQYATGEIKRGYFESVFEVPIEKMGIVERLLQNEFHELNVKYDAGTEFYNKKIISLIEPYLITLGIKYIKLTKQEISDLVRCNRVRKTFNKIDIQSLINALKSERTNKHFPNIKYSSINNILNRDILYNGKVTPIKIPNNVLVVNNNKDIHYFPYYKDSNKNIILHSCIWSATPSLNLKKEITSGVIKWFTKYFIIQSYKIHNTEDLNVIENAILENNWLI
jgi:hypothetical protein